MAYKYQDYFDADYQANAGNYDAFAATNSPQNAPEVWAAYLHGSLAMYEATREVQYLTRVLVWCERMRASCTIVDNAGYQNWSGTYSFPQYGLTNVASDLDHLYWLRPIAHCARTILTDGALVPTYGARATALKTFVTQQLQKQINVRGWGAQLDNNTASGPNVRDFDDRPARFIFTMMQQVLVGDTQWQTRMTQWLTNFVNLYLHVYSGDTDCIIWNDGTASHYGGGTTEDTSHANANVLMMTEAVELGFVIPFNAVFGEVSVANLFTQVIWDGLTVAPKFSNCLNGTNPSLFGNAAWEVGHLGAGWPRLGKYHAVAQQASEAMMDCIVASGNNCSSPSARYLNPNSSYRAGLAGLLTRNQAARLLTRRRELPSERGVTRGVAYVGD